MPQKTVTKKGFRNEFVTSSDHYTILVHSHCVYYGFLLRTVPRRKATLVSTTHQKIETVQFKRNLLFSKHQRCKRIDTYSMLWQNSPFGRLNFFVLSADAEAKAFLKTKNKEITLGIVQVQHLEGSSVGKIEWRQCNDTYSLGWSAIARTDFL